MLEVQLPLVSTMAGCKSRTSVAITVFYYAFIEL